MNHNGHFSAVPDDLPDVGQVRDEGIQGPTILDEKEASMSLPNR